MSTRVGLLICLLLATGCATQGSRPAAPAAANLLREDGIGACARLYREVDQAVAAAGVADAQSARVRGLPYLRLDRGLAAAAPAPDSPAFSAWVDRLRELDRTARRAELANLGNARARPHWRARLEPCGRRLRHHDMASPAVREKLAAAAVPDDYRAALRVLGLYPLTSVPFLGGVARLHRETRATFALPLAALPVHGVLRRWHPPQQTAPLSSDEVAALLARASANPLQRPEPSGRELRHLFGTFAPIWELDTVSSADVPGTPRVRRDGPPRVAGEPAVFTLASYASWQGRRLLQLNYVLWLPDRPRQGPLDLAAGRLDGITWRVTLGADGLPLLYDAMHNCGCYYQAFPTPRVSLVRRRRGWEEPVVVPQRVVDADARLVLRVAAGTHYLQRVYRDPHLRPAQPAYRLRDYGRLRSLALPDGGRRSLFRPDGIVPGTQRRERWLFWPMGVPEPGAMRQWGNHAIAFVGRRHFDDPGLLERHFAPADGRGGWQDAEAGRSHAGGR